MSRRTTSAAAYLDEAASDVSIALAELVESAGAVTRSWTLAVAESRRDPDAALQHLADAEIRLNHHIRLACVFALRRARFAMGRLDDELQVVDESPGAANSS
jgi:hypothetical protein